MIKFIRKLLLRWLLGSLDISEYQNNQLRKVERTIILTWDNRITMPATWAALKEKRVVDELYEMIKILVDDGLIIMETTTDRSSKTEVLKLRLYCYEPEKLTTKTNLL